MDGYNIFGTVLLVFIAVITQSAAVPNNVVWTPPTKTLWLKQTNPNITCEFIGTPYAVYWLKDSETILTWYLKPQPQGTTSYGQGIDRTRFGITADHHTLLFNDLTESDSGTYTCKVSNYNGFIISNQTEVRVLDPRNVVAYTKPIITTWKGSSEYLPCDFTGIAIKVLWNKIDNSRQSPSVETVLRYDEGVYEVIGSNSRFSWNENYQLHVRNIEVLDGAKYTCKVWKTDGTQLQNSTLMTVYALPEEPYVQIAQCGSCMAGQEDKNCSRCTLKVTEDTDSFTLDCSVTGANPKVTDITWSEGATGRFINDTTVVYTQRDDGTFDTRATMSAKLSAIADATSFTCTATGKAVNDTWDSEQTISVRVLPALLPPFRLSSGAVVALCIFFLLILPIILCLLVLVYLYTYRRSVLKKHLPSQVVSCCTCLDLKHEADNDVTSEEIKPPGNKTPNESPDPLIAVLQEKRTDINNYIPGSKSQHDFPRNKIFNIGLYGIMSAGKSAFVNSLSFAVSGEYNSNVQEAAQTEGGSRTLYRETVPLTKLLHILDTRGLNEFDESYVKRILDEIRGKRGKDPKKKVSDGKEIHCPVFVFNSNDIASRNNGVDFVKVLSDDVHRKFGRHVLIVITHKDELDKEPEEEKDQQTGISGDLNEATYQRLIHEPSRSNDSSYVNQGNVYDTIDGNVEEQNATAETAIENATANEGEESRVVTEKKNRGKAFLKHIKGKTHGSRKKDVEVCIDLEEQERLTVNESGEESTVSNTTAVRDHGPNEEVASENTMENVTANEDSDKSVGKEKSKNGQSSLKQITEKALGFVKRKKDVEKGHDIEENEMTSASDRGTEVHDYEAVGANETGNETDSFYDAEEEIPKVNNQKEDGTDKKATSDTGDDSPNRTQAESNKKQQSTLRQDSDINGKDIPDSKLEIGKNSYVAVVQSEGGIVTTSGVNTLSKWKKKIVDHTNVPEQNIWAFKNYTGEKPEEDRERSIEFLDFLSVCLDTAERNAKFRDEYIREKKSKPSYKAWHPNKWFSS